MKKRKIIKWILIFLAFLAISNTPYGRFIYWDLLGETIGANADDPSRHYSSNNENGFSLDGSEWNMDEVEGFFNTYRLTHPQDSVLYRNYKMSPWRFWWWYYYLTSPYYALPYAPPPPDAGSVQRGGPFEHRSKLIYRPGPDGKDSVPYMVPIERSLD